MVEGAHDVEFLKRISRILSQTDTEVPDLSQLETAGVVAFVINNGASIAFPAGLVANGPSNSISSIEKQVRLPFSARRPCMQSMPARIAGQL